MLDMTWQRKSLFEQIWMIKLLGHRMGTRMMGLAPRPLFLRPSVAWGPLPGSLGFPQKISHFLLRRPSLAWGPLAGLSRLFFIFSFGCFLFSFFLFSVSASWIPLVWYENILNMLLFLAGQDSVFRVHPYRDPLILKTTPSGGNDCVEMIPPFKEGTKGWKKRGIIFARECS